MPVYSTAGVQLRTWPGAYRKGTLIEFFPTGWGGPSYVYRVLNPSTTVVSGERAPFVSIISDVPTMLSLYEPHNFIVPWSPDQDASDSVLARVNGRQGPGDSRLYFAWKNQTSSQSGQSFELTDGWTPPVFQAVINTELYWLNVQASGPVFSSGAQDHWWDPAMGLQWTYGVNALWSFVGGQPTEARVVAIQWNAGARNNLSLYLSHALEWGQSYTLRAPRIVYDRTLGIGDHGFHTGGANYTDITFATSEDRVRVPVDIAINLLDTTAGGYARAREAVYWFLADAGNANYTSQSFVDTMRSDWSDLAIEDATWTPGAHNPVSFDNSWALGSLTINGALQPLELWPVAPPAPPPPPATGASSVRLLERRRYIDATTRDYVVTGGRLKQDDGFTSAVVLALSTRLGSAQAFPTFGSRLHEVKRADEQGRKLAERHAARALAHLATKVRNLTVTATLPKACPNAILVEVTGRRGAEPLFASYTAVLT